MQKFVINCITTQTNNEFIIKLWIIIAIHNSKQMPKFSKSQLNITALAPLSITTQASVPPLRIHGHATATSSSTSSSIIIYY